MSTSAEHPDYYAVLGNPVAHSQSPFIHAEFAKATGQEMVYERMAVPLDDFVAAVYEFRAKGGKGCNVTVPFKQQAWELATQRSRQAESAGAVNTLVFADDGTIQGENTDGTGLLRDLEYNLRLNLKNTRILLLGAGGAARGVVQNLLNAQPAELFIANRTEQRAAELVQLFSNNADMQVLTSGGFRSIGGSYDLVINATSASLIDEMPPLPDGCLSGDACCYDMVYGKTTAFMHWAQGQQAAQVVDGLGMLVEQAADSFALWRGVRPDTQPVLQKLRAKLNPA